MGVWRQNERVDGNQGQDQARVRKPWYADAALREFIRDECSMLGRQRTVLYVCAIVQPLSRRDKLDLGLHSKRRVVGTAIGLMLPTCLPRFDMALSLCRSSEHGTWLRNKDLSCGFRWIMCIWTGPCAKRSFLDQKLACEAGEAGYLRIIVQIVVSFACLRSWKHFQYLLLENQYYTYGG